MADPNNAVNQNDQYNLLFNIGNMNYQFIQPVQYIPQIDFLTTLNLFNVIIQDDQYVDPVGAINQPMNDVKNIMQVDELNKLITKNYVEVDKEKYKACSICLEDYNEEDKLRLLKCEHGFHTECIDKWLLECNYKCPVCRDDSNIHFSET